MQELQHIDTTVEQDSQHRLRFLLVEDSDDDAEPVLHELRVAGFEFDWERVDNARAFDEHLTPDIDLVLADYSLPGFIGLEALKRVQAAGLDIPFVLLSGTIGEEVAVRAIQLGAADYLMKDRLGHLGAAVARALEKRRTRDNLQQAALMARGAIDALTANIVIVNPAGVIVMVNQAWTDFALANTTADMKIYGVGDSYLEACRKAYQNGDQDAAIYVDGLVSVLSGLTVLFEREYPCHGPHEKHWFVCRMTAFGAGTERRLVVSHQDITQRKLAAEQMSRDVAERHRAELMLRESEEFNRAIVDTAADAIITLNTQGVIMSFNAAAVQMYGYQASEIIGQNMRRLVPRNRHKVYDAYMVLVRDTLAPKGDIHRQEGVGRRKGGATFPLEYAVRAVSKEKAIHQTLILRDLTERKQAQDLIQRQFERLSALHDIDTFISGSLDLRLTLRFLIDEIMSLLKVDAASVLLNNRRSHYLEYAVGKGFRGSDPAHRSLQIGYGPLVGKALECETIHIENMLLNPEYEFPEVLMSQEGFVGYFALPLIAKAQVVGALELYYRSPLTPDEEWKDFLSNLAGQMAMAIDNATLFQELQSSNTKLTLAYDATIEGWSRALDLRDKETEGHTQRVTAMTLRMARAIGIGEDETVHIRRGALLHDIGKMGIPDSILLKPGTLTKEEQQIMRRHPQYAYDMLCPIAFLRPALDIVLYHHERWDGTGYPRGLKGAQIPMTARIFALADVCDALASDRSYRKAWPADQIRDHICAMAGSHFDPVLVSVFLTMAP